MISLKSFGNFITTNFMLIGFGCVEYFGINLLNRFSLIIQFIMTFIILLLRNFLFLYLINNAIKNKKFVNEYRNEPKEQYSGEFVKNVVTTTLMDSMTLFFAKHYILSDTASYIYDLIMFIPSSFVFELIFDFFHYWVHRCSHSKYLYGYLHKQHHKYRDVSPIVTFYQDPFDVLLSNTLPTLITLFLISQISLFGASLFKMSLFGYSIMSIYKVSVEIYGHSGKYTPPEFVQCIWLPRYLDIVLTSENHSHHHMFNNCNYSKRFSIWDKIFGTFRY